MAVGPSTQNEHRRLLRSGDDQVPLAEAQRKSAPGVCSVVPCENKMSHVRRWICWLAVLDANFLNLADLTSVNHCRSVTISVMYLELYVTKFVW